MFNTKLELFGVTETSVSSIRGMRLCYKVEYHESNDPNYLRQLVLRDKNGNYFLHVKGGVNAYMGLENSYPLYGKEILIPITRESLLDWAAINLSGEEYARALEEVQCSNSFQFNMIWEYQSEIEMGQTDNVYEFLLKSDANGYILFSTDYSYPYPAHSTAWVVLKEDGSAYIRDDLNMYYVTPETACRWAKMRGLDEDTCRTVFVC